MSSAEDMVQRLLEEIKVLEDECDRKDWVINDLRDEIHSLEYSKDDVEYELDEYVRRVEYLEKGRTEVEDVIFKHFPEGATVEYDPAFREFLVNGKRSKEWR